MGVQHRGAKGMGGSSAAERLSNGIILCNMLNCDVEAYPEAAALATAYGWKISKWIDPATVPVYDALEGSWWLLDDAGGRTRVA